jgi:hypothetical protein
MTSIQTHNFYSSNHVTQFSMMVDNTVFRFYMQHKLARKIIYAQFNPYIFTVVETPTLQISSYCCLSS